MKTNTAPVQAWPLGPSSGRLIWGIILRVLCGLRAQWLSFFHGHGITPLWRYGLTPKVANWSLNCPREFWLYLYLIAICKVIWALYSIVVKPDLPKRSFIFVYILVRVITCLIDIMCSDFNLRVCIWILIVRIGTGSYGRGGCRVSNTLCRSIAILVVHWCLIIEYERCRVKFRGSLSQKIFIANVLKSAHLNMLNQTQSMHHLL